MRRGLVVVLVLSFVLVLSVSFVSASLFSDIWNKITGKVTTSTTENQTLCGNGILDTGELCDYAANDSVNNPYGSQCTSNCWVNGAAPYWQGCRGSGVHVCTDNPQITNQYFIDHPNCIKATTCDGSFYNCNGIICPPPASTTATCVASNGGDIYVAGTVYLNGVKYATDYCNFNDPAPITNTMVNKYSCSSPTSNVAISQWIKCPNGCLNGACINSNSSTTNQTNTTSSENQTNTTITPTSTNQTNTSTCTDSDGGLNYYVKGVGTGIYAGSQPGFNVIYGQEPNPDFAKTTTNPYSTVYDFCHTSKQLDEAFCDSNGQLSSYGYQCPNGCSNGVCLYSSTNNTNQTGIARVGACQTNSDCPVGVCVSGQCVVYSNSEPNQTSNQTEGNNCRGCFVSGICYPIGYRTNVEYCTLNLSLASQSIAGASCQNSFECGSNVCVSGQCISQSFLQKIIAWFQNLFGSS